MTWMLAALTLCAGEPDGALIVRADLARRWHSTPMAAATIAAVRDAGLIGTATSDAWARLATSLALTPADTFDAAFGRRVILNARYTGAWDWALVTEIDRDSEDRIRQALRPAARGVVGGVPRLSIENGRFDMAVTQIPDAQASLVLLAPFDSPAMFQDLAPRLGAWNWNTAGPQLRVPIDDKVRAGRVSLLWTPPADAGWFEASIMPTLTGWTGTFASDLRALEHTRGVSISAAPWPAGAAFWSGSPPGEREIARLVGSRDGPGPPIVGDFVGVLNTLLESQPAGRDLAGQLTPRVLIAVDENDSGVSITWAVEARESPEELARATDAVMDTLLSGPARAAPAFGGTFPSAVRASRFTPNDASVFSRLLGAPWHVAWAVGPSDEPATSWWVGRISQSDHDGTKALDWWRAELSRVSGLWRGEPAGEGMYFRLSGRPARGLELLHRAEIEIPQPLAASRWVDSMNFVGLTSRRIPGAAEGLIDLNLRTPDAAGNPTAPR